MASKKTKEFREWQEKNRDKNAGKITFNTQSRNQTAIKEKEKSEKEAASKKKTVAEQMQATAKQIRQTNENLKKTETEKKTANTAIQNAMANKDITPKLKKATKSSTQRAADIQNQAALRFHNGQYNNLWEKFALAQQAYGPGSQAKGAASWAKGLEHGAETGVNNLKSGYKQGLLSFAQDAAPYLAGERMELAAVTPNKTAKNALLQQADAMMSHELQQNMEQQRRANAAQAQQKQQAINQKYGDLNGKEKVISDVMGNAIPMAPAIVTGALSGGTLSSPMFFAYGRGMGEQSALNGGATMEQANRYGLASGALEAGTEALVGGLPGTNGLLNTNLIKSFMKSDLAKKLTEAGVDIAGEGLEEILAGIADPYIQRATWNPNAENATGKELAYQGLLGALTSGVMKGAAGGVNFALHPNDITPKLVKAGQNAQQEQKNAQNEQQNAQTTQKNQAENAQNAQNGAQQPINNQSINTITNQQNAPQSATSQAGLKQAQQNPKDITPKLQTAEQAMRNQQLEPTVAENTAGSEDSSATEYKDYDVNQLPKDVFDFYNQVGEVGGKAHFNIRFVQNIENDAEGKSDGHGNILVSAERANDIETLRRVVAHECYHAMKNTEQWKDIQDLAYELYKLENPNGTQEQMLQAKIDQYYERSGGKAQLDTDGAWDEIGAELMGEILSDPKMADRIWNQNPTLAQRIVRWLEDMVQKLQDFVFKVEAEDSIYRKAFEAYNEGIQNMRWQGGAQSESRYKESAGVQPGSWENQPEPGTDAFILNGSISQNQPEGNVQSGTRYSFAGNSEALKKHQLDIIQNSNPMQDDYHTGIRSVNDILTFEEAMQEESYTPDYTEEMARNALRKGTITVYSSYPIEQGVFVTPSKMEAQNYAGNGNVYSKTVGINDVAWVDTIEGQYANAKSDIRYSVRENAGQNIIIKNIPTEADMQRIREEYKNSTDEEMYDFIDDARRVNKNRYYRMTDISDTEAADIKQLTGIDVTGFSRKISSDSIRHIENRHGAKGAADSSLKDDADIARMNYVLENYDTIEDGGYNKSNAFVDKDNKPAPIVIYSKRVNGTYYVVEAVPDTVRKSVQIVTAYKSTKKEASKQVVDADHTNPPQPNVQNAHAPDASFVDNSISQNNPEGNGQSGTRYSLNNKDVVGSQEYKDLLDEHGSMPEGENPTGENYRVEVPRRTAKGNKTRQFVRNVMEASTIDDVTANMTAEELINGTGGDLVHEPLANKAVVDAVNERIANNGWEREYDELHKDIAAGNRVTAEDVTMGIRAIQEAQKAGDYKAAAQMVTDLAIAGTELGQSVQAYTLLKRLTPEGQLLALKRVQQRINKNLVKQGKKPVSEMSEETMIEFLEARGEGKRSDIWNREIARMGQETEGTWADKINAVRYTAMLCNPKTHIKNIIGNVAMTAARQPTIAISAALEDARGAKDKALHPGGIAPEQYRSLHNRTGQKYSELKKYAEMNYKTFAKDVLQSGGNRYQNVSSAFENNKRIFGNSLPGRVLEQLAGSGKYSVSSALEAEDMMFKHRTYVSSLVGYMKANGITTKDAALRTVKPNGASIEKGEQYALQQAKKATFTEDNKVANGLTNIENLNAGTKLFMGGFMPYKRTPMNILTRGVEYSPAGLIMTGYKMVYAMSGKTGNSFGDGSGYNMNDVFESLGANMTGSAIMTLGILLAREGFLAGAGDEDDERKRKYNQQMGDQNYAVVNPETGDSYTIDWLAPVAMPLFAGVEVYNQLSGKYDVDDETNTARIIEAIGKITDPAFEMSFMQGVANALASYSGDTGDIASTVGSTIITGYAGQFIPSVVGAAARTIDDTVRSSYAPKTSSLTKKGESFLRQQRSKIPFASMQNEASIDVWGNERKREYAGDSAGDFAMRALNNFILPWNYSSNKRTALDNELESLYQSTGDSGVFPAVASGTINASEQNPKISMTPLEFSKFSTTKGKKSQQYVSDFVNSEAYDNLADSEKADIISSLYDLANYEARKQILNSPERGYSYSQEDKENVLESGVKPYEYYSTQKRFDGKWAKYETAAKYAEHADKMGMTDDKYVEMNEALNDIKADKKNGKTVSGSREKKVKAYLNSELNAGNITKEQWWYWYAMEYSSQAKNSPYAWQRTLHDSTDSTTMQQTDKDKANQSIQYATMLKKPNR